MNCYKLSEGCTTCSTDAATDSIPETCTDCISGMSLNRYDQCVLENCWEWEISDDWMSVECIHCNDGFGLWDDKTCGQCTGNSIDWTSCAACEFNDMDVAISCIACMDNKELYYNEDNDYYYCDYIHIPHCAESIMGVCQDCEDGWYLDEELNTCWACAINGCEKCTKSTYGQFATCDSCVDNWVLVIDYYGENKLPRNECWWEWRMLGCDDENMNEENSCNKC